MIEKIKPLFSYWFTIAVCIIIAISTLLRFYNFENRWGFANDQARDVIVAREALALHKLPLIGPFSSAGQFVYGPQWLWILMLFIIVNPKWILWPWIVQAFLYVLSVGAIIAIGKKIEGRIFAVIVGLLAAVSPAQISHATNLTSPSMVGFLSMIIVLLFIYTISDRKKWHSFVLGFFITSAVMVHFQAIGLLVLLPLSLLFGEKTKSRIFLLLLGAFLPLMPLMYFDVTNNFFETRGILDYYFHGQYNIYVPNRWLTYIGVFWPGAWARIVGGEKLFSVLIMLFFLCSIIFQLKRHARFKKEWIALFVGFFLMFVMFRYYRGIRYDGYIVFLHPFILLFTGWTVVQIIKTKFYLGVVFLCLLIFGGLKMSLHDINTATNTMYGLTNRWIRLFDNTYPQNKYTMFDYKYTAIGFTMPLVLVLDYKNKIDSDGYGVGLSYFEELPPINKNIKLQYSEIIGNRKVLSFFDVNNASKQFLANNSWALVTPETVYMTTVEWYKEKKL
ncbi:MAG: hypothetical protein HYV37_02075 [Candidatus Levyibacteriota bacterium]|nr:MAG: hypothetical protein HYV37_02075 [Candidatus Levybacteria bacterium]